MELKCPQCGKWMEVSQEELVIHDCQVVCPQCLAVCRYENGALVARIDSETTSRRTANAGTSSQDHAKFCHNCGKQLPSGISFCPYCGADLKVSYNVPKPDDTPKPVEQKPIEVKKEPVVTLEKRTPEPKRQEQSNQVENNLRSMTRHYNTMHPHLHQRGTMPSKSFKIIAYSTIILLLALLVWIIIAGLSIESTI